MKFSILSLTATFALFSHALATPSPQPRAFHCPPGYRCCGPLIQGVGGTWVPCSA
ncbi:hypothetical protein BYT27DRAFT_7119999 [Phlegmacium glaucopus]|nr:hypothetical protein BYT27DRAFT_7119999 [Phlegmacium glaucopus]